MLSQEEMDKVVLEAKKSLSEEQMKDALRKCSYGGIGIGTLDCKGIMIEKGGVPLGKTNA